jgi:hypothetical protein
MKYRWKWFTIGNILLLALAGIAPITPPAMPAQSTETINGNPTQRAHVQPQSLTLDTLGEISPLYCAGKTAKSNAWVQINGCTPGDSRIIAWPLFSIATNGVATPVAVDTCLYGQQPCGLDTTKQAWFIGAAKSTDPIQPSTTAIKVRRGLTSSSAYKSLEDEQDAILSILAKKMRLVELAWRMGKSHHSDDPIFMLSEGTANNIRLKNIGSCQPVTVGEVTIDNLGSWKLQSQCTLHSSSATTVLNKEDIFLENIAVDYTRPFQWIVQRQTGIANLSDTQVHENEVAHLKLFPYTMVAFSYANGSNAQPMTGHGKVPVPADLPVSDSADYLLTLDISLSPTVKSDPPPAAGTHVNQEQPYLSQQVILWLPGAALLIFTLWLLRRKQLWPFPKKHVEQPASVPPAPPQGERNFGPAHTNDETGIGTAPSIAKIMPEVDARTHTLLREEVRIATSQWEARLDARFEETSKRLRDLEREIAKQANQDSLASVSKAVENHLEPKFSKLLARSEDSLSNLKVQLEETVSMLDQKIDDKLNRSAMGWARSLSDNLPQAKPDRYVPQAKLVSLQVSASARGILGTMQDISDLAFELLALWPQKQQNVISNWEETPPGKLILADLRTLQSIVFIDRPLWMWALGDLAPSHLTESLLRVGMNRWRIAETGGLDAATVARDWAKVLCRRYRTLLKELRSISAQRIFLGFVALLSHWVKVILAW